MNRELFSLVNAADTLAKKIHNNESYLTVLNSNNLAAGNLTSIRPFPERYKKSLKEDFGVDANPVSLFLLRELAFIILHQKYGIKFKPLQSPLLGNVS